MNGIEEKVSRHREALRELLARGGAALTLAVISFSNRDANGEREPWSVLSPELIAGAEQIGAAVAACEAEEALALAVQSALAPARTALPEWLTPTLTEPKCLSFVGRNTGDFDLLAALGPGRVASSDRERGLAALALALCRRQDTLLTLASRLPESSETRLLIRMGRLANVTAAPGEPSKLRSALRRRLKGASTWDA